MPGAAQAVGRGTGKRFRLPIGGNPHGPTATHLKRGRSHSAFIPFDTNAWQVRHLKASVLDCERLLQDGIGPALGRIGRLTRPRRISRRRASALDFRACRPIPVGTQHPLPTDGKGCARRRIISKLPVTDALARMSHLPLDNRHNGGSDHQAMALPIRRE